MSATELYGRAKLLAADAALANVCDQFANLCRVAAPDLDCTSTQAAHRVLADTAPTPQSRTVHSALALLLAKAEGDAECAPLGFEHARLWAACSRYFTVTGVRQAAAQFAIETEVLLAALHKTVIDVCQYLEETRKRLQETEQERDALQEEIRHEFDK